jgi:histidine triad (HIT) family protein
MPPLSSDCFVCRKHTEGEAVEGGVIWIDDLLYAGHCQLLGRPDIYLGWLVVEPRRHVAELGDLTRQEASAIGVLLSRLAEALCASESAEHVYSFVLGDGVGKGHLHVHLIPRYPGTPGEYLQQRVVEWPGGPRGGVYEVQAVSERIRRHLLESGGPRL